MHAPTLSEYDRHRLEGHARDLTEYATALETHGPTAPIIERALKERIGSICFTLRLYIDDPHEIADRALHLAYLSRTLTNDKYAQQSRALAHAIDTFLNPPPNPMLPAKRALTILKEHTADTITDPILDQLRDLLETIE